jgi:hypothetical protein
VSAVKYGTIEAVPIGAVELETGEVVLAALLALRSLLLNLSSRADKGPLREAWLRGLVNRADPRLPHES